mgnify:CR=1 FL=1
MHSDIIEERLKKLEMLRRAGNPYPARVVRSASVGSILADFKALEKKKTNVTLVGRVRGLRVQGGLIFADVRDESGQLQAVMKREALKEFALLKDTLDIGDFLEVVGTLFVTQKGERSILADGVRIVSKSIRPLPSEWYGLSDTEKRLRERYVDLLVHPETKELFVKKFRFWNEFRKYLNAAGFEEVETSVLEQIPGGAEAEPFVTHHNALDTDYYLRISLELPLKKLIVGGFEKVFEIGRVFRNEGIDAEHLQDYTSCELYWAYTDYEELMMFVEAMYKTAIANVFGTLTTKWQGKKINWGKKWPKVEYYTLFKKHVGIDLKTATSEMLYTKALTEGLKPEVELGRGRLIDMLFKKFVRPTLIQPVFLVNPPVDIEPLAKRLEKDPGRVARFQIVACGTELGKGFSELNDPIDQRKRFEEQMKLREKGDKEAQQLDEDFLRALEYGMPPTSGFGFSERLFAILADKPVREMVFFPLMRPKENDRSN